MDKTLHDDIKFAQAALNKEADKARDIRFRTSLEDILNDKTADPEQSAKQINKLLKEYDSLPDYYRV